MSTIDSQLIELQQQFNHTNNQLSGATTQIIHSIIDSQLTLLKQRIAELEEKKRAECEKEAEKKANPMKVLKDIIDEKKQQIENNRYSKLLPQLNDNVAMLEPILNVLQDIQKRLTALENK